MTSTLWAILGIVAVVVTTALVFKLSRPRNLSPATPATLAEVERLARAGEKITAIKCYREIYHVGLYEAKQAVEAIAAGNIPTPPHPVSGVVTPECPEATLVEVENALRSGNKIGAIKCYRELTNVGLAEAKKAVDDLEATMKSSGRL